MTQSAQRSCFAVGRLAKIEPPRERRFPRHGTIYQKKKKQHFEKFCLLGRGIIRGNG